MTVEYPDLADYRAVASAVTGAEPAVVLASMKPGPADSALHAPAGSWSNEDFYPDFIDEAAGLLVWLAKNHPLLDGNKRAAWVTLRPFIEMSGWTWRTYPGVDEAEQAVLAVSSSEWDEERTAARLRPLLGPQYLRGAPGAHRRTGGCGSGRGDCRLAR